MVIASFTGSSVCHRKGTEGGDLDERGWSLHQRLENQHFYQADPIPAEYDAHEHELGSNLQDLIYVRAKNTKIKNSALLPVTNVDQF